MSEDINVHELRRRWLPHKDRLNRASKFSSLKHPLPIRMHRAFSWLSACEPMQSEGGYDEKLIFRWIALNALYGRWDSQASQPAGDVDALKRFCESIVRLDQDAVVATMVKNFKTEAMEILSDKYVNDHFWRMVRDGRNFSRDRTRVQAQQWYQEESWPLILEELLGRIYVVRCQLIHGASTFGGRVNRPSVSRCASLLHHIVIAFLVVIIERGYSMDWGDLCYPPIDGK